MTRSIAVVGGGIAGLTAAFDLHRQGHEVHLLEAADRLGGKLHTARFAGVDLDSGPDSVLARVPWALELFDELGLDDEIVPQPPGSAYLYSRGELRRIPQGTVLGIPTDLDLLAESGVVSPDAVARAADDLTKADDRPDGDESVGSLIRRRLGDEILERLVDPLLGGINAGDTDRLSLAAGAPQIAAATTGPHASLIEALRAQRANAPAPSDAPVFYTLSGGLGRLVDALVDALDGADLRTGTPIGSIERDGDRWQVSAQGGTLGSEPLEVDAIVLATPASVAADLLGELAPVAAAGLARIDYSSVALVAMAFADDAAGRPLDGTGFLVPRAEGLLLTACSWASTKWPHLHRPGQFLVRASAGRFGDERAIQMDDEALVEAILADLATTMDLHGDPTEVRVTRWPRSFPQYTPGHLDRVAEIERALAEAAPDIALAGAAYRGVGIPACINSGRQAARALTE